MYNEHPTLHVCVWCAGKNDTPLLLCELCEARAVLLRQQRGEVVRSPNG